MAARRCVVVSSVASSAPLQPQPEPGREGEPTFPMHHLAPAPPHFPHAPSASPEDPISAVWKSACRRARPRARGLCMPLPSSTPPNSSIPSTRGDSPDGLSPYEYTSSCSCACETNRYRGHGDDWAVAAPRLPRQPWPWCGGRRKARGRGWCRSSFPPSPTSSAGTLRRIRESRAGSGASQGAGVWRQVVSPPKAFHPISRLRLSFNLAHHISCPHTVSPRPRRRLRAWFARQMRGPVRRSAAGGDEGTTRSFTARIVTRGGDRECDLVARAALAPLRAPCRPPHHPPPAHSCSAYLPGPTRSLVR
jgi:hypothetical protein